MRRINDQSELFIQFTGQRTDRLFMGLDLATRLHEGLGAAFANQQGTTIGTDQQGGGNADDAG
ncbi:hypothetical protein D3C76_1796660 [compost metagenome]